ncbi:MAG: uroporphyrinogen-III synthase [Ruegeria sp.]
MTRPRAASERFVAQLPVRVQSRIRVVYSPLLDIQPIPVDVDTSGINGLIFSSANAVNVAASLGVRRDIPAYCVGPVTTETAQIAGWASRMVGGTAEELVANLLSLRPLGPLMHLRGEHGRGNIAERLTDLGLTVRELPIYTQNLLPLTPEAADAAAGPGPIIAPIFSPRSARQFANVWPEQAPLLIAAISEATAEPLENLNIRRLKIAKRPTPKKMRKAVKKLVKYAMRLEGGLGAD